MARMVVLIMSVNFETSSDAHEYTKIMHRKNRKFLFCEFILSVELNSFTVCFHLTKHFCKKSYLFELKPILL